MGAVSSRFDIDLWLDKVDLRPLRCVSLTGARRRMKILRDCQSGVVAAIKVQPNGFISRLDGRRVPQCGVNYRSPSKPLRIHAEDIDTKTNSEPLPPFLNQRMLHCM